MAPYTPSPSPRILITGCSSGIGLALAQHLSTRYPTTTIFATARTPSSLSTLTAPNIVKLQLDVTSQSSIDSALANIISDHNGLDILINNAGYNILADAETVSEPDAQALMDTNFWGPVRLIKACLPIFRGEPSTTTSSSPTPSSSSSKPAPTSGLILNITSLGGRLSFAGNSYYHASKFGLEAFSESLSKELCPAWNIHVCNIEPGGVKTAYARRAVESRESRRSVVWTGWYAEERSPTNVLHRYHGDERSEEGWASAKDVARVVGELVFKGTDGRGEVPVRVPLGADSWGMQKKGLEVALERLEKVKDFAFKTSKDPEKQLAGVEFMQF